MEGTYVPIYPLRCSRLLSSSRRFHFPFGLPRGTNRLKIPLGTSYKFPLVGDGRS